MSAPLPAGWERRESKSQNGRVYYFCAATKESSWDVPTEARPAATAAVTAPCRGRCFLFFLLTRVLRNRAG